MTNSPGHLRNMTFNQTFQSSLVQRNNEKFIVDKSLIKGIKQNDVGKIIDQNQVSTGTQNKDLFDQFKEVQGIVIDTRKRFDKIKSETLKSQQQIQKLKHQKEILLEDKFKYNTLIQNQRGDLNETQKRMNQITALLDAITYRKDIYGNIKEVAKHDLLVLKKRYFDKDVTLMRESTKLRTIRTQHQSKLKLSKRCRQVLESVQKSVNIKQNQRNTKIQSFCDVLTRKQANQQNRQIRQKQIQQAMMSAMTDKLAEQKQWIKMLNANMFLKGVLKARMQRLMQKYNKVQLSFHKMKQATSLKDSNQFIQRFLTREQTYGMLLQSISQKQRQLEQVKEQREQLQKIHQNYLFKNQQFIDEKRKKQPKTFKKIQVANPNSIIQELNEQSVSIVRKKQLMYQWATKFLAALNGHSQRDQIIKKYPKYKLKQLIIEVLSNIKKYVTKLQAQQNHSKKIEEVFLKNNPKEKTFNEQMLQKNTRIKTLSTYENQGGDFFQDKDVAYDDLSEADYLQYNRRAIKKSDIQNRKFRIKTKPY